MHLSHLWIKEVLVELLLHKAVFECLRTHEHETIKTIKSLNMHTHPHPLFLWKVLYHKCYLAVLQLCNVTPSVYWVLFVWCCLTSAWEESTLPLLRWLTLCFRGVVVKRAEGGNKPRWCHQELLLSRSGREEALSVARLCFPRADRSSYFRYDRCDILRQNSI